MTLIDHMEINDRISILITALDINPASFATQIGVKAAVVHNIIKGRRSKPSYDVIKKILKVYTTVNTDWLLRGKGSVLVRKKTKIIPNIVSLESRLSDLMGKVYEENIDNPQVLELVELTGVLIEENNNNKQKIVQLHERNDKFVDVVRQQLKIEF
jgi:transcriptional regulator with XRE-family HTH domain